MTFNVEEFLLHRGDTPMGDVLMHYASEYYDPAKAHEYYLKNRELKGKQSTKGMSETQRNAWSYTKNQIGERKKAELKSKAEEQKARLEELKAKAEETRDRLQEKLKGLLDSLNGLEQSEAAKVAPPNLIKIPTSVNPKIRAYLQKQNEFRLQGYRDQVSKAQTKARETKRVESEQARAASKEERLKIGNELKSAVSAARSEYEASKKQITDKYDAAKETEYQNIKTQLPGAVPKAKKPKKAPAAKKPRKKKQTTETEGELQNGTKA